MGKKRESLYSQTGVNSTMRKDRERDRETERERERERMIKK